ncbi:hypothetical protein [Nocardia shimofusensis]|uniref:hypothetical protein n=1 Tax=Nocardia shimofusensis TaxID=228596 RepID=UPI0012ED568E|nr:hypothetical protein [Nocardia shimofusensis]
MTPGSQRVQQIQHSARLLDAEIAADVARLAELEKRGDQQRTQAGLRQRISAMESIRNRLRTPREHGGP